MPLYPRDLSGYANQPPKPLWPGEAKIAVQLVLNYEEGGENCLLHGDAASEAFLSEIVGAAAWSGQRHWNMESIYEYGARAGFWRLYDVLKHLPITVYGVATALARSPEQVAAMKTANWDLASHGLKWIEYKDYAPEDERAHMQEAIELHTQVVGKRPTGWYTGRCSENTVRLAAEEGGFDYVADSYADDLPYWIEFGDKQQLIVPYTLDCNDMRFATSQGFNSGDQFEHYLIDSFDALYEEGLAGQPKMMSVGLHCRLVGRPGRIQALKRFLNYIASHEGVWIASRQQIAEHWKAKHPFQSRLRPSRMSRTAFVESFGSIYEHSPWVADGAYDLEISPAHDNPEGVHSLLARIFRAAGPDERLKVLVSHPNLAGKLAQAKRLTAESTEEQAAAGLGALTDEEKRDFTALNEAYMEAFAFPFIIAAKDNTKTSILKAFRERLKNTKEQEFEEACRQVERIAQLRLYSFFEKDAER